MAMCAGVQKVSRPMDRCQETSQAPPMEEDVMATTPAQIYQGMRASDWAGDGGEAKRPDDWRLWTCFLQSKCTKLMIRRLHMATFPWRFDTAFPYW